MEETLRSGGSIKNHTPSRLNITTNLSISNHLVRPTICKSGAPTHSGSRSSSIKETTSSMSVRTKRSSLSVETMIKMEQRLLLLKWEKDRTNNGMLSILIKPINSRPRDSMRNSDSTSIDHSTWSQDSHFTESLKLSVPTTWYKRDTPRVELHNNSSSMKRPRPSDPSNGRTTAWKSNPTVDQPMLE